MAYRFTNTEKWQDNWFNQLSQIQMLLFIYLCDNCDIAGFIEINLKRWASDLNSTIDTIKGAIEGLSRGLIISNSNDCLFIKNFCKHQKNLPLNPERNPSHKGIIKRMDLYLEKFGLENYIDFLNIDNQGLKGLCSPIGNGNGNGNGNDNDKKDEKYFIIPGEIIPETNGFFKFKTKKAKKTETNFHTSRTK